MKIIQQEIQGLLNLYTTRKIPDEEKIANSLIQMPLDWHILLGDSEVGELEIVPLTSLNDRTTQIKQK